MPPAARVVGIEARLDETSSNQSELGIILKNTSSLEKSCG